MTYMSVLVMTTAAAVVVVVVAVVDTLTGSVFASEMSKHAVSPREVMFTTDAKHDDQLSKVKSSFYK